LSQKTRNSVDKKTRKRKVYNLEGSKSVPKLWLDDALKKKDDNFTGWSEARKKAYKAMKQNPNAYHMRFNTPGETQSKGSWSKQEHKKFMQLLYENGANNNWGVFSINIQGRVGYQCSDYYRKLIKQKKIWDPNYWYDGKRMCFKHDFELGEAWLKYAFTVLEDASGVFGILPAQHPKRPPDLQSTAEVMRSVSHGLSAGCSQAFRRKVKNSSTHRKLRNWKSPTVFRKKSCLKDTDSFLDLCFTKISAVGAVLPSDIEAVKRNGGMENPDIVAAVSAHEVDVTITSYEDITFTNFSESFTKCQLTRPAISPHWHAREHDSWTKILMTPGLENLCPFTKKIVKHNNLLMLTHHNVKEFKGKVVNQAITIK